MEQIAQGIATVLLGAWLAYKEIKERKTPLPPNPKRCEDHAVLLGRLDERVKNVEKDISEINERLSK